MAKTISAVILSLTLALSAWGESKTLYARLGGYDGIVRLVDHAFPRVAGHPQLQRFFQGQPKEAQLRQRQHIIEMLCYATGGPCSYTGEAMKPAHRGLGITADDWRVFMQIIRSSLEELRVTSAVRTELLDLFERRFRADVIDDSKGEKQMSSFTVHTIESAPEGSKSILANMKSEVGFIPNLAATMAESPALLEAFTSLRTINGQKSSLSASDRELVSIAVATEYGCSYCVAAHSTFAIKAGASEGVVAAVREGGRPAMRGSRRSRASRDG